MLYPREFNLKGKQVLVDETQMVNYKEHMLQYHRMLFVTGLLTGEMDSHNLLLALDSLSHKPIKIVITSAGGDLDSTFFFIDIMKMIQSPIITIGRYCASAACLILASGKKRYLYPHAKTMMHLDTGQMGGDYKEFDIHHKLMLNYQNKVVDILISAGARKTKEEILHDIDRDFWMEPEEVIDYGLADSIITNHKWLELMKVDYACGNMS